MILAEPVGEHIPLNLEQFRNHQHQRVDIDDKSDERQVPAKEKRFITLIMAKQRSILGTRCIGEQQSILGTRCIREQRSILGNSMHKGTTEHLRELDAQGNRLSLNSFHQLNKHYFNRPLRSVKGCSIFCHQSEQVLPGC